MTDAERELYQAPFQEFVVTRDRLVAGLKAAGDKAAAAALAKRKRPSISAWAVNQVWWHARVELDALFATAERLRAGEHAAAGAHRDALAALRARAAALLAADSHPANEAVLRRVTATLSAIAAAGGFDPDPPGALVADRDPPGFEALTGLAEAMPSRTPAAPALAPVDGERAAAAERERAAAAERVAAEHARALQERKDRERRDAHRRVDDAERAVERATAVLAAAQAELADARAAAAKLDR
jgi:hypothetical protein